MVLKEESFEGDPLIGSSEMPFKCEAKAEATAIPSSYRQQQDLWNPFQYHDGFGHAENSNTSRWVEGLVQVREC